MRVSLGAIKEVNALMEQVAGVNLVKAQMGFGRSLSNLFTPRDNSINLDNKTSTFVN